MKNYLFIIAITGLLSCSQHKESSKNSIKTYYDYEVLYNYQGKEIYKNDKYRNRLSSDSLYIIVEASFVNDTLEIKSHNKIAIKNIVNTEESSGIAADYVINHNINNLDLRINNGPWICIDVSKKEYNIIGIRKESNKIQVIFYKKVPVFE